MGPSLCMDDIIYRSSHTEPLDHWHIGKEGLYLQQAMEDFEALQRDFGFKVGNML